MQTEPAAVPVDPISAAVLRSYCHATAGILAHIVATTPVPHTDIARAIIRDLQRLTLLLPVEGPRAE